MRKMYKQPQTEAVPVEMENTVLSTSQAVGIKEGEGSGEGLAPKRRTPVF